jgi:hypothetical protein
MDKKGMSTIKVMNIIFFILHRTALLSGAAKPRREQQLC